MRLANKIRTLVTDLRYGAILTGAVASKYSHLGAAETANSNYDSLDVVFSGEAIYPSDVLVDVGCGKGRVINWWLAKYPNCRIIGLELDPDIAGKTCRRLRRFPAVTIQAGDATTLLPPDATVFYLFNPFRAEVLHRFSQAVVHLRRARLIFYHNCVHLGVFQRASCFHIRSVKKIGQHETAVIEVRPSRDQGG